MSELIDKSACADLLFSLKWKSEKATHTDQFYSAGVNFWRDFLPPDLEASLMGKGAGDQAYVNLEPGIVVPNPDERELKRTRPGGVGDVLADGTPLKVVPGRFYPRGILKGVGNVFPQNMAPFRCLENNGSGVLADFNHPLSGKSLDLEASVISVSQKNCERGGSAYSVEDLMGVGPGMQARVNGAPTEFLYPGSLKRDDEDDSGFYGKPRMVHHLDAKAREVISGLYGRLIKPGGRILDLMSSWKSHIPDELNPESVFGIGLNQEELNSTPRLSEIAVYDLNLNPILPLEDESFDAAVCTASVEYLTSPLEVFSQTARVLRPGGLLIVTFSNRWFPTKAVSIWKELHEFERMGLAAEYFFQSGVFEDVNTLSVKGWPRPEDDPYAHELMHSDPVYAVWGRKK